ncbi:NrfD/PsrC family molybdoenzyme membrane anchor subunit [Dendrosporobacter sp. 1207_IL3150]|uniref:NrfD/PsrC family molybdoenzyme membrane anchor subunit n=1 Tax=Dendrosporobacter sp. 1207_IL3150 TaxID=3084054 RepID=UPI002FDA9DDE
MVWGTLVAIYLFMAGIAAGTYLLGTIIETFWSNRGLEMIRKYSLILSFPLVAISSIFLVVDAEAGLHNPLRLIYILANFPNSMMSVGTLIIASFQIITLYAAWRALYSKNQSAVMRIIGSVMAVGLTVYTGLLLQVSQAIPFWHNDILPILFTVSGISTGFAAAIIIGVYADRRQLANLMPIKKVHILCLLAEGLLLIALLSNAGKIDGGAQSVAKLLTGSLSPLFWGGLVTVGLVLPIIIEAYELFKNHNVIAINNGLHPADETAATIDSELNSGFSLLLVSEGAVLLGGFILRYLVLAAATFISLI